MLPSERTHTKAIVVGCNADFSSCIRNFSSHGDGYQGCCRAGAVQKVKLSLKGDNIASRVSDVHVRGTVLTIANSKTHSVTNAI